MYRCTYLFINLRRAPAGQPAVGGALAFTRYCHCQYCMVYGIQKEGPWGGRIMRISRAMVLQ